MMEVKPRPAIEYSESVSCNLDFLSDRCVG